MAGAINMSPQVMVATQAKLGPKEEVLALPCRTKSPFRGRAKNHPFEGYQWNYTNEKIRKRIHT
jgi:hypothetical protein